MRQPSQASLKGPSVPRFSSHTRSGSGGCALILPVTTFTSVNATHPGRDQDVSGSAVSPGARVPRVDVSMRAGRPQVGGRQEIGPLSSHCRPSAVARRAPSSQHSGWTTVTLHANRGSPRRPTLTNLTPSVSAPRPERARRPSFRASGTNAPSTRADSWGTWACRPSRSPHSPPPAPLYSPSVRIACRRS